MRDDELMTPWPDTDTPVGETAPGPRGGATYGQLHRAQRLIQDLLAGAALESVVAAHVTRELLDLAEEIAGYQVPEADRFDGWRPDLPGRGHPLLPPYVIDAEGEDTISGRVTFTRFYLGGNGAAHGGAHPLLFDDLLGRVMNHHQPGVARTAYLHVNYRRVTPIGVELRFEASRDRVEGRKRFGSARLFGPSGDLLSDVDALFIQLVPGQA